MGRRKRPIVLQITLKKNNEIGILQVAVDVKTWHAKLPGVGDVRPGRCPRCGVSARIPGRCLMIHGHGCVARALWGPLADESEAGLVDVYLRRYRCLRCGTVLRVGPSGVLHRFMYCGVAVALALWLWAVMGTSASATRARVSPWRRAGFSSRRRWRTLRRWLCALREGRLWDGVGGEATRHLPVGDLLAALGSRAPDWSNERDERLNVVTAASQQRRWGLAL